MILSKRYDEIMAHIEVTDEMKSRILNNIQKADITAPQQNVIHFPDVKNICRLLRTPAG